MKKLALWLLGIWMLIGTLSLFVWLNFARNLTVENVAEKANQVAKDLEIPWVLKFKRVIPGYGVDFKVTIEGLEAWTKNGERILSAQTAEVRFPWPTLLLEKSSRINVWLGDVTISNWDVVLSEVKQFLDQRKLDSTQQVSIPKHFLESIYNLRLNKVSGPLKETSLTLQKLYLLNLDPNKPTAFEMVLPWERSTDGMNITGETKILGEYRLAKQKMDLHFYLKTRFGLTRDGRVRSDEFSVEGKGFFHPRMGLFATLSSKDDWVGFVGDLEWTDSQFKMMIPKFALSTDLVLDLLPFNVFHLNTGAYQGDQINGAFTWLKTKSDLDWSLTASTNEYKFETPEQGKKSLNLNVSLNKQDKDDVSLSVDGVPWITYARLGKTGTAVVMTEVLPTSAVRKEWTFPHDVIWNLLDKAKWQNLALTLGTTPIYHLARAPESIQIKGFVPNTTFPVLGLNYSPLTGQVDEWTAQFNQQALENFFLAAGIEFPFVPGQNYTGVIMKSNTGDLSAKLGWKGSALALLSRSSCKGVMQENPSLKNLFEMTLQHQAEVKITSSVFTLTKWSAKSPADEWQIQGSWSNSPIKCNLNLKHKAAGKKLVPYEVNLN